MPAFFSFIILTIITFLSKYIKRKNKEKTENNISPSTLFLAFTVIAGLLSLYLWIPIDYQQKILQPLTEHKTSINQYYDFKKRRQNHYGHQKRKSQQPFRFKTDRHHHRRRQTIIPNPIRKRIRPYLKIRRQIARKETPCLYTLTLKPIILTVGSVY